MSSISEQLRQHRLAIIARAAYARVAPATTAAQARTTLGIAAVTGDLEPYVEDGTLTVAPWLYPDDMAATQSSRRFTALGAPIITPAPAPTEDAAHAELTAAVAAAAPDTAPASHAALVSHRLGIMRPARQKEFAAYTAAAIWNSVPNAVRTFGGTGYTHPSASTDATLQTYHKSQAERDIDYAEAAAAAVRRLCTGWGPYDLNIFQGAKPHGRQRIVFAIGEQNGLVSAGIQKLAEHVVMLLFLTVQEGGTGFVPAIMAGQYSDAGQIMLAYSSALFTLRELLDEYPGAPADEQFADMPLSDVVAGPGLLMLTFNLTTAAGTSRPVLVPVQSPEEVMREY